MGYTLPYLPSSASIFLHTSFNQCMAYSYHFDDSLVHHDTIHLFTAIYVDVDNRLETPTLGFPSRAF